MEQNYSILKSAFPKAPTFTTSNSLSVHLTSGDKYITFNKYNRLINILTPLKPLFIYNIDIVKKYNINGTKL